MIAFTIYVTVLVSFSNELPCSCGGVLQDLSWQQHMVFNIAFTGLAFWAIILNRQLNKIGKTVSTSIVYEFTKIVNKLMFKKKHIQNNHFLLWLQNYRITLLIAVSVILVQMIVWKYLYPHPNFLPDSYSYLEAAMSQKLINIWPIGYSKFLWWFSFITRNHNGLVWLQYLLLEATIFYFTYTVFFLLKLGKSFFRLLLFAGTCHPLTYMVSNLVSSDALFSSLSLVWFTQILWILYRPTFRLLLFHALILTLAFTVRYNALYFPFISCAVLLFSVTSSINKIAGITIIFILVGIFIGYTQYHFKRQTGKVMFSPFGGWQLASNALFACGHIPAIERNKNEYVVRELHAIVDRHMDSLQLLPQRPDAQIGIYYMWDELSPLNQYMHYVWMKDSATIGFSRWVLMGEEYKKYGTWLIRQYPIAFIKYYIWPNLINYYVPGSEFLGVYNMGKDTIDKTGMSWFKLKTNKILKNSKQNAIRFTNYLPIAMALINWLFVFGLIGFTWLDSLVKNGSYLKRMVIWLSVVWVSNTGFSVFASPIVLRYQVFPLLITQTFMIWFLCRIIQENRSANPKMREYRNNQIVTY